MRKIKVLGNGLTKAEIEAARNLAIEGGYAAEEIEVVGEVGQPDPACDEELILVVMTPAACADPVMEIELKKTPNGGRRAICVWPENTDHGQQAPAAAANYAYSIITWNPEKFCAVAADDDVMYFETPAGTAMPKVKMDHNCCVEVQAKPT